MTDLYALAAFYRSDPAKALEIAEREGRETDRLIKEREMTSDMRPLVRGADPSPAVAAE